MSRKISDPDYKRPPIEPEMVKDDPKVVRPKGYEPLPYVPVAGTAPGMQIPSFNPPKWQMEVPCSLESFNKAVDDMVKQQGPESKAFFEEVKKVAKELAKKDGDGLNISIEEAEAISMTLQKNNAAEVNKHSPRPR